MKRFEVGDRVRVDIPNEDDPDHDLLHRKRGTVIEILEDDANKETGDPRDSFLFTVEMDDGATEDLRWRDLRPVSET
ncbi:hypothetical protein [Halorientalis persicus]|uniref:hypothetical protein n=1 Tax=Halorientalis persicus TaxID=1367881 RepID=UPI000B8960F4